LNLETDTDGIGAILLEAFFLFHFLNNTEFAVHAQDMIPFRVMYITTNANQSVLDLKNVPLKNIITPCEKYSMSCKNKYYFFYNEIFFSN
jgi:hypothetical protein